MEQQQRNVPGKNVTSSLATSKPPGGILNDLFQNVNLFAPEKCADGYRYE
jgi:hypothetical protein